MTNTEIVLGSLLGMMFVWQLVVRGKVKVERETLHNRISALADESHRVINQVKTDTLYIAKNAQGIASNALSSAQRAEAKIAKLNLQDLMVKDMGTVTLEKQENA